MVHTLTLMLGLFFSNVSISFKDVGKDTQSSQSLKNGCQVFGLLSCGRLIFLETRSRDKAAHTAYLKQRLSASAEHLLPVFFELSTLIKPCLGFTALGDGINVPPRRLGFLLTPSVRASTPTISRLYCSHQNLIFSCISFSKPSFTIFLISSSLVYLFKSPSR
jgi:hypothetical protein